MNLRPLLSSLVAFTLLGTAAAQQNEELEFNQRQAKALNAFAKKAFDKFCLSQALRALFLGGHP